MEFKKVNVGEPNKGNGDTFIDGWKKVNHNFDEVSRLFNIQLKKVQESGKIEDIRPNFIIINDNFSNIEKHIKS